ncbi:MAG: hypothetical protein ACREBS_08055 [Nitrososphaerales archaeon]
MTSAENFPIYRQQGGGLSTFLSIMLILSGAFLFFGATATAFGGASTFDGGILDRYHCGDTSDHPTTIVSFSLSGEKSNPFMSGEGKFWYVSRNDWAAAP